MAFTGTRQPITKGTVLETIRKEQAKKRPQALTRLAITRRLTGFAWPSQRLLGRTADRMAVLVRKHLIAPACVCFEMKDETQEPEEKTNATGIAS